MPPWEVQDSAQRASGFSSAAEAEAAAFYREPDVSAVPVPLRRPSPAAGRKPIYCVTDVAVNGKSVRSDHQKLNAVGVQFGK
jgi:hypothetical protein